MTRPNRDGASGAIGITDLIIKAFQWWNWMDQFDRGYSHIARFARHHLLRHVRDTAQRKKVWDLIVLIEDSIPIFRARGFDRVGPYVGLRETEQRLAANRCTAACAALTVYWGDPEIIQGHCGLLVGRGDQWAAFSQALTENSLKGWKDWRQSPTPLFWLKGVTDTIAEKESRDYTTVDLDVLPLEEIAEMPADAVLERRFTMRSVAELEAAAENDIEMRDYVAYKVSYPDWQASELWHALGWDAARGKAVDRRYRRLLNQLRENGAGMEWRTAPVPGFTSATYFFETLYDGARGAERGVWQHADAIPPTSLPIAPFRPAPSV